jgi:hypothetical protein
MFKHSEQAITRGHHEWQQFTMWSTSWVGSYLTLVSSFTCMPRRTHRGWPKHYPIIHSWSEVRYRPTHRHTMPLSLGISYVSYASVHLSACSTGFNRRGPQSTQVRATTLELQIYDLDHSQPSHPVFSIFSYLPYLVSNYDNYSIILLNHIGPPPIQRALSRVDSSHSSSTDSLHN